MGTNGREVRAMSEAVSAELRSQLARHRWTVRRFAAAHNLPLSTLHKTLNAGRVVDVEDLYSICVALGIEPADVIEAASREVERSLASNVTPFHKDRSPEVSDAEYYDAVAKSEESTIEVPEFPEG
ncbi:helix-turn-helix transcriptional regulator [Galbitalea sp. SE-J8]|uniref:helix-turn-helix domain-containing protein n=1 Tax=Galbitalea sp. SE-J8 TaxID=3054952 RepID=UPI00259D1030|nr:helix-turn-helix transcriptional regulator [Galbitalea sp. SE-J8]MDM4761930.1 helix-turn-helix transcriptional regulator [Galbitalea sp. SE-J8]